MHRLAALVSVVTVIALPVWAQQAADPSAGRSATPRAGTGAPGVPNPSRRVLPTVLPGTPEYSFATVHGNALDALNHGLPNNPVRLRDARAGRIVDIQLTDNSGLFAFRLLDPGSYVAELLSARTNTVLAASEILSVDAGEVVSAFIRLPFRDSPFAAVLGHHAGQAGVIIAAAAASGLLTQSATAAVSCEQLPCTR
jgi:hypothetical protein